MELRLCKAPFGLHRGRLLNSFFHYRRSGSKKAVARAGQRLKFSFAENCLTCDLSGRISEKPGGDVLPGLPEPAGKA